YRGACAVQPLYFLQDPGPAVRAQAAFLQVDPFHGMGRSHGTRVVLAVSQVQSVADLVDALFQQAFAKRVAVRWQTVEFLAQPVQGNQSAGTTHLGLSKDKGQYGYVKIDGGNPEQTPAMVAKVALHLLQQFRGVILLALAMERDLRVKRAGNHFARNAKGVCQRGPQLHEQTRVQIPNRQQLQNLHRVSTGRLQPYRLIL